MKKSAICITLATLALAGCNNDEKNAQDVQIMPEKDADT